MAAMRLGKCTATLVVPTFLMAWERDEEAVQFLSSMEIVVSLIE